MGKPLPKSLLSKLVEKEIKQLQKLQGESDNLGKEMVKYQAEYVVAFRKGDSTDGVLRKMADKGFKYEKLAFEAADKLNEYKDFLIKKYKKV
jgi:hypothetical protein